MKLTQYWVENYWVANMELIYSVIRNHGRHIILFVESGSVGQQNVCWIDRRLTSILRLELYVEFVYEAFLGNIGHRSQV